MTAMVKENVLLEPCLFRQGHTPWRRLRRSGLSVWGTCRKTWGSSPHCWRTPPTYPPSASQWSHSPHYLPNKTTHLQYRRSLATTTWHICNHPQETKPLSKYLWCLTMFSELCVTGLCLFAYDTAHLVLGQWQSDSRQNEQWPATLIKQNQFHFSNKIHPSRTMYSSGLHFKELLKGIVPLFWSEDCMRYLSIVSVYSWWWLVS